MIPNFQEDPRYILRSSGPSIDPWGTPASTGGHLECWPLTVLCCLSLESSETIWVNFRKCQEFVV